MSTESERPLGLGLSEVVGRPDGYAALLRSARDVFARSGTVEVGYGALSASMLNVGWAPLLAADLRTSWRRDEKNAAMIFGA